MGTWSGGGGENEDRKAVIDFCGFNESQSLIPRWALMDTTIPGFFPSVLKAEMVFSIASLSQFIMLSDTHVK